MRFSSVYRLAFKFWLKPGSKSLKQPAAEPASIRDLNTKMSGNTASNLAKAKVSTNNNRQLKQPAIKKLTFGYFRRAILNL